MGTRWKSSRMVLPTRPAVRLSGIRCPSDRLARPPTMMALNKSNKEM